MGRVPAPPELWHRVAYPGAPRRSRSGFAWALACAAAAAILAVAAVRQHDAANAELRSSDAAALRDWVRLRTGMDVPLPAHLASSVRLVSAKVTAPGAAEIDYQVDGRDLVLLASVASAALAGDGRHRRLEGGTSWTMRGILYSVNCPPAEVSQLGCRLCHAGGDAMF